MLCTKDEAFNVWAQKLEKFPNLPASNSSSEGEYSQALSKSTRHSKININYVSKNSTVSFSLKDIRIGNAPVGDIGNISYPCYITLYDAKKNFVRPENRWTVVFSDDHKFYHTETV